MLRNIFLVTLLICSACADDMSSTEDDLVKSDPELPKINGDLTCYLCKKVVSYVKSKISSDTTVEKIKKILHSVCDHLPLFKDSCKTFVSKYADKIAVIIQKADPETVCKKISVC
ncbi:prosaposin-like [Triplophysa dalaica]|uniref:prosaposin-like n=1 Tax=Triplophysa dalaica TaxID=1582913 RepID=UPI0024DF415B|nr:prosaposin-like [Triplophysa dalaica]